MISKRICFSVPLFSLLVIMLNGCLLSLDLVSDNTSKDFLKTKYANIDIYTGEYNEDGLKQHLYETRKNILESSDLSDLEKKNLTDDLEKVKYEKGKYFFYTVYSREPLLNEKKPDKFQFIDKNNTDLIEVLLPSSFKVTTLTQYGSFTTYQYIYLIKLKKSIDKQEFKDNGPFYLIAFFDNGRQNLRYIIK
jgi:hypothetical protein